MIPSLLTLLVLVGGPSSPEPTLGCSVVVASSATGCRFTLLFASPLDGGGSIRGYIDAKCGEIREICGAAQPCFCAPNPKSDAGTR